MNKPSECILYIEFRERICFPVSHKADTSMNSYLSLGITNHAKRSEAQVSGCRRACEAEVLPLIGESACHKGRQTGREVHLCTGIISIERYFEVIGEIRSTLSCERALRIPPSPKTRRNTDAYICFLTLQKDSNNHL